MTPDECERTSEAAKLAMFERLQREAVQHRGDCECDTCEALSRLGYELSPNAAPGQSTEPMPSTLNVGITHSSSILLGIEQARRGEGTIIELAELTEPTDTAPVRVTVGERHYEKAGPVWYEEVHGDPYRVEATEDDLLDALAASQAREAASTQSFNPLKEAYSDVRAEVHALEKRRDEVMGWYRKAVQDLAASQTELTEEKESAEGAWGCLHIIRDDLVEWLGEEKMKGCPPMMYNDAYRQVVATIARERLAFKEDAERLTAENAALRSQATALANEDRQRAQDAARWRAIVSHRGGIIHWSVAHMPGGLEAYADGLVDAARAAQGEAEVKADA